MSQARIGAEHVARDNEKREDAQAQDYAALGAALDRRGMDIEAVTAKVQPSRSPCLPGGSAPEAPVSRASRGGASRAASSTSSMIAPSSTS